MMCDFLAKLTFRSLIAPVAEEEFRASYWEQKPLIVHRGNPAYYGDLFTLQDFDAAIMCTSGEVKMANAANKKISTSYRVDTALGRESVLADMRNSRSIILEGLHERQPKLGLLCRLLEQELSHHFQTNLYLTPPFGEVTTPHWDNHDVFILQVMGSKHWQIEKERRTFPGRNERTDPDSREFRGDCTSFTVNQGDLIYIPRGFVHAAKCGAGPSLHITVGIIPIYLEDLLNATIKAAIERDKHLRSPLPLGFMHGGKDELINSVMTALREIADPTFVDFVVDRYRDDLVRSFQLDISGQLVDFFQQTPLASTDVVGPRRGVVYRTHDSGDSVRLNVGTRSITFPSLFRESLNFALNTSTYAIRDIPGELEDEERVVFIERLMQEGLLVRK